MITHSFLICPKCQQKTKPTKSLSGADSEFWLECSSTQCNTYINTYVPQDHQAKFHKDPSRFTANFGGYGSGKTLTSREEFYKHVFITPNGNTLIGANVTSQYEQTIKRDIENDIPKAFVSQASAQKGFIDFINGHRVIFRPFDDVDKLRSYNLTMFVILEASEVKLDAFIQLKSRLRNTQATSQVISNGIPVFTTQGIPIIDKDWRCGIIESNPDSGWIRSEVLLKSNIIHKHGGILDQYPVLKEEADPSLSTHVTATDANKYLPPSFLHDLAKNRPAWWVAKFIRGSFMYSEGLVYPGAMKTIVPAFDIPKHWKRIIAYDYGLRDDSVFVFGAVDEIHSILFIYKAIHVNNKSVADLAQIFHNNVKDIPTGGLICSPIIDPKSAPKRDYDKKTLADHFLDYGISFMPGQISVDARIYRLNTYFESGKIKIMDCCTQLIQELRDYKFKARTLEDTSRNSDKPEDKNNHGINALEWIVMELPSDPKNLVHGIYNKQGSNLLEQQTPKAQHYATHALSDVDDEFNRTYDMIDYHF